ncbi:MAG: putative metal-dependent hydrolase [Gemmatimonadaceae bacterium]|nr:putative metal-dependent hydrolase [Gemmatimonadaceae bacterium]
MTDATEQASEQQRFPIGRHQRRDIDVPNTPDERTGFIERLAQQTASMATIMDGLEESDWGNPYRPGGWTVQQLVHHVADSHANALIRLKVALTEDVPTIKPYDQDAWVTLADCSLPPHVSLMMFMAVQTRLISVLHSLDDAQFRRRFLHPENGPMTVDQLLALYAWHGDHHIAQLQAYKAARA